MQMEPQVRPQTAEPIDPTRTKIVKAIVIPHVHRPLFPGELQELLKQSQPIPLMPATTREEVEEEEDELELDEDENLWQRAQYLFWYLYENIRCSKLLIACVAAYPPLIAAILYCLFWW